MNATTGQSLDGTAHLAQSIADILGTPLGTRTMRRDYGSLLFDLIDQPLNAATGMLLRAASALALRQWEPRLRLRKVTLASPDGTAAGFNAGGLVITIDGDRTDLPQANASVLLSIPLHAGGATPVLS